MKTEGAPLAEEVGLVLLQPLLPCPRSTRCWRGTSTPVVRSPGTWGPGRRSPGARSAAGPLTVSNPTLPQCPAIGEGETGCGEECENRAR